MKLSTILFLAITFMLALTTTTYAQLVTENNQVTDSTKNITIKVKGITCSNDLKTISRNVVKLKGVSTCKAGKTGPTTTFEIAYNLTLISEEEIFAAIQNTSGCKNPDDRPYKVKQ
jgi:copper chaperone CopZ